MNFEKLKSRPPTKHWKNSQGFTLLEVIIALGIVAVGILAVSRAITGFAETTISLEQRLFANWVASNRLETHRIFRTSPVVGETRGSEEMADQTWYFREKITATADPLLFRIDISVYSDKEETEEAGSLYGYLLDVEKLNLPIITSLKGSCHCEQSAAISLFNVNSLEIASSQAFRNDELIEAFDET
jgi:general secretion pathway protein I